MACAWFYIPMEQQAMRFLESARQQILPRILLLMAHRTALSRTRSAATKVLWGARLQNASPKNRAYFSATFDSLRRFRSASSAQRKPNLKDGRHAPSATVSVNTAQPNIRNAGRHGLLLLRMCFFFFRRARPNQIYLKLGRVFPIRPSLLQFKRQSALLPTFTFSVISLNPACPPPQAVQYHWILTRYNRQNRRPSPRTTLIRQVVPF